MLREEPFYAFVEWSESPSNIESRVNLEYSQSPIRFEYQISLISGRYMEYVFSANDAFHFVFSSLATLFLLN